MAGSLTAVEVARLHRAIRSVIGDAVEHGGTSFVGYINEFRGRSTYLAHARVFHRDGEPCRECGTPIKRIRVAARGTSFCPYCQR